jgi:hypothetical protein
MKGAVLASLTWDRGTLDVWACGGAIHDLTFTLGDGRLFAPLAESPWRGMESSPTVARHLANLGGEWPCVPFGSTEFDPAHHGFGTDNDWALMSRDETSLRIGIDYPANHPVLSLRRTISAVPGSAAVRIALEIAVRHPCVLPIGLHPVLRLTEDTVLEPGTFDKGQVFPETFEPGVSRLEPSAVFGADGIVPTDQGQSLPIFTRPSGLAEELVQLIGCDGRFTARYPAADVQTSLHWNSAHLPDLLIWISNHGRQGNPWRGTFAGIGIEPVNSHFDRATIASVGARKGIALSPDQPLVTEYMICATSLPG